MSSNKLDRCRVLRAITRLNVGGPSRHVRLLMEGLDPERFEQLLAHGPIVPSEGNLSVPGSQVLIPTLQRAPGWRADRSALLRLRQELQRFRPHLVHSHQGKAGALARLAAHRERVLVIVHTYHGHTFRGYFGRLKGAVLRRVERWTARVSQALVCQSVSQESDVLTYLGKAAEGKTRLILPAIEPGFFAAPATEKSAVREELGLPKGACLLLLPARLVPIKRPQLAVSLLSALRAHVEAHLVLAGTGALETAVREQVAGLGLTRYVHLIGHRADMCSLYHAADLVILTSQEEGTPLALLEALAAGAAVASTRVGGVFDLVGDMGLMLDPGASPAVWAREIADLLNDAPRRHAWRAHGMQVVRTRHHPQRLLTDVESLYAELMERQGPSNRP